MSDWGTDPNVLNAADAIRAGGVIAYPTEAVYGLGCNPDSGEACRQILSLKHREQGMGLILIASTIQQFDRYLAGLSQQQLDRLQQSWPGPITWLVPNNGVASDWVTGGRDTLALRVTNHPVAAAICEAVGGPITSTSANPHGHPPAVSAQQVLGYFPEGVAATIDGPLGAQAKPTEIRELLTGKVIRSS